MSAANQDNIAGIKKVFLNLAAGYAIIVPAVFVIYILLTMESKASLRVSPLLAASFLISSFVVGILLSMFGRTLGVGLRALVLVGTLVSGVLGGILALALWYLYGLQIN